MEKNIHKENITICPKCKNHPLQIVNKEEVKCVDCGIFNWFSLEEE